MVWIIYFLSLVLRTLTILKKNKHMMKQQNKGSTTFMFSILTVCSAVALNDLSWHLCSIKVEQNLLQQQGLLFRSFFDNMLCLDLEFIIDIKDTLNGFDLSVQKREILEFFWKQFHMVWAFISLIIVQAIQQMASCY